MAKALSFGFVGFIGWLLYALACSTVAVSGVVALLPEQQAPMPERVDWIEELEPVEFSPVLPDSIGPKAGETVNIPGVGPCRLGEHAELRHGEGALEARIAFTTSGGDRYDCGDGRIRLTRVLDTARVAIMVIEGSREVTAFVSEKTWKRIQKVLERDGCSGPPGAVAG